MSQLTNQQRQIRSNIRNAYFCEDVETIESEIERRTDGEDFLAVRFLRELKEEALEEMRRKTAIYTSNTVRLVCTNGVFYDLS